MADASAPLRSGTNMTWKEAFEFVEKHPHEVAPELQKFATEGHLNLWKVVDVALSILVISGLVLGAVFTQGAGYRMLLGIGAGAVAAYTLNQVVKWGRAIYAINKDEKSKKRPLLNMLLQDTKTYVEGLQKTNAKRGNDLDAFIKSLP